MNQALLSIILTLLAPTGYKVTKDLAYGEGPRRTLDVYMPAKAQGAPVVVFFYGGSWDSGDKGFYKFVGAVLATQGVVAVIPDYRVYPEVNYPAFLQDSAKAVAWAKANAAGYGGDPDKLVLMGHSAGAYNAAMLAVDARWLRAEGLEPERDVRALVGISGPYDFLPLQSARLKTIFGPEATLADTQPVTHVDGMAPPALLLHGADDKVVWPRNAERLAARIKAKGGEAEVKVYPRLGHAETIAAFLPVFRRKGPVLADVMAFIRAHTGGQAAAVQVQRAA
jgi:acetyl esterase/lipase